MAKFANKKKTKKVIKKVAKKVILKTKKTRAVRRPAATSKVATRLADTASTATARLLAQACHDKKGLETTVLDLRNLASFTDYFLLCTGSSDRHVQAIADGIGQTAKQHHVNLFGSEGFTKGQWILLDYGDVVAHLFQPDTREFYDLEGLWRDAPRVRLKLK